MKHKNKLQRKRELLQKRRWRIRKKIIGTAGRLRLSLKLTNGHIYAQCINDDKGETVLAASTASKESRAANLKANKAGAIAIGKMLGEKAKAAGAVSMTFDRNGRRYCGCVQTFADAVREAGIAF